MPPRSPARRCSPGRFCCTRSWTVTTIGTRGRSSAPAIQGEWKRSSWRRGWRPSTISPPRRCASSQQALEQAARVAPDPAPVGGGAGVEADAHHGPVPAMSSLTPA